MTIKMTPGELAEFEKAWPLPIKAEDVRFGDSLGAQEHDLVFVWNDKTYRVRGRITNLRYTCHNGYTGIHRYCRCEKREADRSGNNEPGQDGSEKS